MKRGSLVRMVLVASFLLPAVVAAVPGDASACGTAIYLANRHRLRGHDKKEVISNTALVAEAEQALSEGRHTTASRKAIQAFPALKIVKPGNLPLADRALRILALASVRSGGAINTGGFKAMTANDRAANLKWSIETLRTLETQRAHNPTYRTDLGEALAAVPEHHAEAGRILGELADKDLLTTAEGYAALARLRAESGDEGGRQASLERCQGMTKTPAVCYAPAAATPSPASRT